MFPEFKITTENIKELADSFLSAGEWFGKFVDGNMEGLGRRVAFLMRMQIRPHKVTGTLEESIKSFYEANRLRLTIGPTLKFRGGWDAGLILQRGTKPIPNLPFGPIAKWAGFRGIPAGPVWMSIKTKGVKAHPFLDETLARGDVQTAIRNTAGRIGFQIAARAVQKLPLSGGGNLSVVTSEFTGER